VSLHDSRTVIVDIGYDVSDDVAAMLMIGVPPEPTITGAGAVSNLGALGRVRYGPVVLSGVYRLPRWGALRPYVGAGVAYAVIVKSHDAAVRNLDVHNDWGFVLQAGAEYQLDERWAVFADAKKVWLSVDADGHLEGGAPVKARVQLNPLLLSVGAKYHFR
jgi:outer membrane protein